MQQRDEIDGSGWNPTPTDHARDSATATAEPRGEVNDAWATSAAAAALELGATAPARDAPASPCAAASEAPAGAQTERLAAMGLLSAGLMHEINNPLAAIIAYAQFLLKGELATRQRTDVEHILIEAMRASRIVQSLLTFARPMRPHKSAVDLNQAVANALAARQRELELDDIAVDMALKPGLPLIAADGNQLQQVFINIVNNARDAMVENPDGRRRLSVGTDARDGHVCVRFDDTGPGIPEHCLGRIFDPFFTTKEVGRGTGLGLAVCHGIIREHGGRISAANLPQGGARFVIELPAATPRIAGPD